MAISATASIPTTMAVASPSPANSRLSQLSSLQFPSDLMFPTRPLKLSTHQQRKFVVVASRLHSYNSFDELLETADKPVLVDFYATWCGPCQFMVPVLQQVGSSMVDKVQIVKIDTEKYPELGDKFSIQALPTFILFKDGKPIDRFEGAMNAEKLIARLEEALLCI